MKINWHQQERGYFTCRMFYVNFMVTTSKNLEQKHKHKKGESEQITMENHQLIRADRKRRKKEQQRDKISRRQKIKWQ